MIKKNAEYFVVELKEKSEEVEMVVNDFVIRNDIDLMILGTNIRPGSHSLYLGPRVENILEQTDCSVIIFNTQKNNCKVTGMFDTI